MSPNSNNPALVSRIDDLSPRRKKKLPVQSAVLLSSAPRRLTGQNVGGISLGYEGLHVYRGWGYHGAHAVLGCYCFAGFFGLCLRMWPRVFLQISIMAGVSDSA